MNPAPMYLSCPIASRYINTPDDARAYYAYKLVGEHAIAVAGVPLRVRFNHEETHVFTDERSPCPPHEVVVRGGRSAEVRCFSLERARLMDKILATLQNPAVANRAQMAGGISVYGPADTSARRLCVVVAPAREADLYFVRTAFPVTPADFLVKRRAKATPWPPK